MDTLYLKTLLAVIETGSFSKAADCLCITQSAVSQRIKQLEERYGYTLLNRSGGIILPTAAGELVLQKAKIIIDQEKALIGALKRLPVKCSISFCCSPCFAAVYLPALLSNHILPNSDTLDFRCQLAPTTAAIQGLRNSEFNVIVVEHFNPLNLEFFNVIPLSNDEMIFVSNERLGIDSRKPDLTKLLKYDLLMRKENSFNTENLAANLALFGKKIEDFRSVINLDDPRLIKQTVLTEPFIAYVSRTLIQKELANGSLHEHMITGFNHLRFRSLVSSRSCSGNLDACRFVTAIIETVRQISAPRIRISRDSA